MAYSGADNERMSLLALGLTDWTELQLVLENGRALLEFVIVNTPCNVPS